MTKITLSDFRNFRFKGKSFIHRRYFAEVTVTEKRWFRKPKQREETISKTYIGNFWRFAKSGEFTPDYQAEDLEEAWRAQGKPIEEVPE